MSETTDRMNHYEANRDAGDSNADPQPASDQPQPAATTPAPENFGNDDSDTPIPTSTPQSPVQTEETEADKRGLSGNSASDTSAGTDAGNSREYREV